MFMNKQSWKCLLGPMAKNICENNNIFTWTVGKKQHFVSARALNYRDIPLISSLIPCNFYYLSHFNFIFLSKFFKISKSYEPEIIIPISNLSLNGRKFHGIRNAINKCKKYNITLHENLNNIDDLHDMLEKWSDTLGDKYFQNRSGKNKYFYKNNLHKDCINLFCYKDSSLISFATLSRPNNKESSYIIGKALSIHYPGLSEFTDIEIYKKALLYGTDKINLAGGGKNLIKYKSKFPNAYTIMAYDGTIHSKLI